MSDRYPYRLPSGGEGGSKLSRRSSGSGTEWYSRRPTMITMRPDTVKTLKLSCSHACMTERDGWVCGTVVP